jgi:hypothetical protein
MAFKNGILFLLIIGFCPLWMQAQAQDELETFNRQRLKIQKSGMTVLGVWAVGNIATGIAGASLTDGATAEFYKMNAMWNGVNLLLAVPGYIGARKGSPLLTFRQTWKQQAGTEKIFLANAALDVAYMAGGLYLHERGRQQTNSARADQLRGFGNAIVLQGGFLLVFDTAMYLLHRSHAHKKLYPLLDKIVLDAHGAGIRHSF